MDARKHVIASHRVASVNSLRRRGGLFDDADEAQAGAALDVVLLLGQDEGLGRHHLQPGLPRLNAVLSRHLRIQPRHHHHHFEPFPASAAIYQGKLALLP